MTLQVDMETRENKYRKNQQIQERKAIKHKITLKQQTLRKKKYQEVQ